jgi:hypothetical protein
MSTLRALQSLIDCNFILMTGRRVQLWVWWLLPFLVARALMPVGFMAQAQGGKLQIVLCSGGFANSSAGQDSDHDSGKHADGQDHFSCPFAHAAAAPLLDVSSSEKIPYLATAAVVLPAESPYYAIGPPRFIATRGPPRLS